MAEVVGAIYGYLPFFELWPVPDEVTDAEFEITNIKTFAEGSLNRRIKLEKSIN
jgi:hypothetical protein